MYKVYIVDDEEIVRQGLKMILDWNALGFEICGEAADGISAFKGIMSMRPDLILVDIHMPKLHGLDLANKLRSSGYKGRIIVLSGYSEFKYAQEAIMYGVDFYMTKPIEEDDLKEAVKSVFITLNQSIQQTKSISYYQEKAKFRILEEIIKTTNVNLTDLEMSLEDLGLVSESYQILLLNKYDGEGEVYSAFCQEMKISTKNKDLERLQEDDHDILLLKGSNILKKLQEYLAKNQESKDKPFFISLGDVVEDVRRISYSYTQALTAKNRSFYSKEKKFIEAIDRRSEVSEMRKQFTANNSREIGKDLYDKVIVRRQVDCRSYFDQLFDQLSNTDNDVKTIKNYLAGMFIYVINEFKTDYAHYNVEFKSNSEIINLIQSKSYLYEIMEYISEEIYSMLLQTRDIGSDGIMDEILNYISSHSGEDLKLKNIAPKFGYNSCYLGKIFNSKVGMNFNEYLHHVRVDKAKELLKNSKYKVYEISNMIGYNKVDYFHMKFKEYVGVTPTEYRTEHEE